MTLVHLMGEEPESIKRLVLWAELQIYPLLSVDSGIDMEIAIAVSLPKANSTQTDQGALSIRQLDASLLVATTIHRGRLIEVGQAITALFYWAAQNDYSICGNCREIHIYGRELDADKENITVEVQTPVQFG